jgi:hypothetical protein
MGRKSQEIPYPEIRTYTGTDATAQLHRIRCEREPAECLVCTLISDKNRKIWTEPEYTEYIN